MAIEPAGSYFTPEANIPPQPQMPSPDQGNGMAVAGLVMGILAIVLFWVPLINWVLAILGIIFGAVGISKANKIGGKGKGMAITGLVLGCVSLLIGVIIVIVAVTARSSSF